MHDFLVALHALRWLLALIALGIAWMAWACPRKPRHQHTWAYEPPSLTGWGICRCTTCPHWDIYA